MTDLLEAIREKLKHNHVSFAELSQIEGFRGDLSMSIDDNLVIWSGMSQEACDALETIRQEGEYELVTTPPLIYFIDGMTLDMPIAKRLGAYKKPHWAPCVLSRRQPHRTKKARTS
jgi:hypothetical protein